MNTGIFIRCQPLNGGAFESVDIGEVPIEVLYSWLHSKDREFMRSLAVTLMGRRKDYDTYLAMLKER